MGNIDCIKFRDDKVPMFSAERNGSSSMATNQEADILTFTYETRVRLQPAI